MTKLAKCYLFLTTSDSAVFNARGDGDAELPRVEHRFDGSCEGSLDSKQGDLGREQQKRSQGTLIMSLTGAGRGFM